jgi:hypothetical protein
VSEEEGSGEGRVVLGRKDDWTKVGFQWTGEEPEGLYDIDQALALGAVWDGDELVVHNYPDFEYAYKHLSDSFLENES